MTKTKTPTNKRISELLKSLKVEPETTRVTLEGQAVSRSETNLHLAVATGIVAIPLDQIEQVKPLRADGDPMMVSVNVKDGGKVKKHLGVEVLGQQVPVHGTRWTGKRHHVDTATATNGPAFDATDDVLEGGSVDDCAELKSES